MTRWFGSWSKKLGRKLSNNAIASGGASEPGKKVKGISTAEVREQAMVHLFADERQSLQKLCTSARPSRLPRIALAENQVLNHAVAHVFERKSVVPEHELLSEALSHRLGAVDLDHLKAALKHLPDLVKTERGFSTHKILATELDLIQTVNAGCDAVAPLHPGYKPADWLGEDQRRAVYHVLRTSDRITGLRGLAGSGKTRALRELVAACNEAKIEPLFCAPTAAATDVLRKEGFEAKTLQSLLFSKPASSEKHLVVLDEAGAVGMDDMKRLFDYARDARIILSGDTGQHASVARGDALRMLERHSHFKSEEVDWPSGGNARQRIARPWNWPPRSGCWKRSTNWNALVRSLEVFADGHSSASRSGGEIIFESVVRKINLCLLVAPTWR